VRVSKNKKQGSGTTELVVRIRPLNGKDTITVEEVDKALVIDDTPRRFTVSEVEGGSLDREVLAQMVREAQKTMWESLSDVVLRNVKAYGDEWQKVKDQVEKLLCHHFAQCPACGVYALADCMHEGVKFICPACEAHLRWKFIADTAHPQGGRYLLDK
jgi:hypothetical protein